MSLVPKNFNLPIKLPGNAFDIPVELGVYVADAVSAPATWNLPRIGAVGTLYGGMLMINNTSASIISLVAFAGQTISDAPSYNIATGASVIVFIQGEATWTVFFDSSVSSAGSITGPGSSTVNALVRWGDATGTSLLNSSVLLGSTGSLSGVDDLTTVTTGSPVSSFDLSATPGRVNLRKVGSANVVKQVTCMSSLSLTGTSPTSVQTFSVPTGSVVSLNSKVVLRSATSCGSFDVIATFKNIAGTVTQVGTTVTTQVLDDPTWAATFTAALPIVLNVAAANGVTVDVVTAATINA